MFCRAGVSALSMLLSASVESVSARSCNVLGAPFQRFPSACRNDAFGRSHMRPRRPVERFFTPALNLRSIPVLEGACGFPNHQVLLNAYSSTAAEHREAQN